MAIRWETPASVWLEDADSAQFALAASTDLGRIDWLGHGAARLPDVAELLGAALPAACRCAAIYPEDFAFCPNCGSALARPSASGQPEPDWWGPWCDPMLPRQVPQGLPVTALALAERIGARAVARGERTLAAPPNAACIFAAGHYGFPVQRLLALAPARGVLQYWDPHARLWQVMVAEEYAAHLAFGASAYGWLPTLYGRDRRRRGEVALVPTDKGLCHLSINPVSETYHTEAVFDAAIVGAPGALRRHLACLFASSTGTRLWSAEAGPGGVGGVGAARLYDCPDAPAAGWSRPIAYDNRLIWLHERGQLFWQPGAEPRMIAWPPRWSPRLAFGGPVKSRDGRLWQVGHDGRSYSFVELFQEHPQTRALDGARLGFAGLLFRRGHAVVADPWDVERVEERREDDSLVLPLLRGFIDDRPQPNGLVLRLHQYTGKAEDALDGRQIALATLEWIGERNVVLDELRHLARPQDCIPFVYDGCLWLHHPDWSQMRGWRLEGRA